jgi:hypothetical protein
MALLILAVVALENIKITRQAIKVLVVRVS